METLLSVEAATATLNPPVRGPGGPTSDDLTNLSWVSGTPVPMNTSVSPPEGVLSKKIISSSSSSTTINPGLQHVRTEKNSTPIKPAPAKKLFKTPLPTYKIVLKDQKNHSDHSSASSPDKDDGPVIFANIMSEQPSAIDFNEKLDIDFLLDKVIPEDSEDDLCGISNHKEEAGHSIDDICSIKGGGKSYSKPNCSYTCLIGMALKASNGCLPVNAVYQYIEKEFPYFLNAPDGWKNSVRHNLSLNPIFCKVNPDGWFGKKGHLWEVSPNKQHLVDKEIDRFLHSTGKKSLNKFSVPMKTCYSRIKASSSKKHSIHSNSNGRKSPVKSPVLCSKCTRIISPTLNDSSTSSDDSMKQQAAEEEVNKYSTEIKEEVKSCGIQVKPKVKATESALDVNENPIQYAGMQTPMDDPKATVKDLFGLPSSPEQMTSPMNYAGPFLPFYPQAAPFGYSMEGFCPTPPPPPPVQCSPPSSSSTPSPIGNPMMTTYAVPVPIQYMLWGQYAQFCNSMLSKEMCAANYNEAMAQINPTAGMYSSTPDHNAEMENGHPKKLSPKRRAQQQNMKMSSSPDLTSPKKMKFVDGSYLGDANTSSYFADVSTNEMCSDSDQDDEMPVRSMHEALLLANSKHGSSSINTSPLSHLNPQLKEDLEQITGSTDLGDLLTNGFKSIANARNNCGTDADSYGPCKSPDKQSVVSSGNNSTEEDVSFVFPVDVHDIDSRVSSSQHDPYYLPRLDSLLHIGDETIMTIKTAMNLDIQGMVEVVTTDESKQGNQEQQDDEVPNSTTSTVK